MKVISRKQAVKTIEDNKGKFFTATFKKKDGSLRTINCVRKNKATTKLGYLNVYSIQDKDYRNIDPRTLVRLNIEKKKLKIK
jgi:hypothetical protein